MTRKTQRVRMWGVFHCDGRIIEAYLTRKIACSVSLTEEWVRPVTVILPPPKKTRKAKKP